MTDPSAPRRDDDEHIDVRFAEIVAGLTWDDEKHDHDHAPDHEHEGVDAAGRGRVATPESPGLGPVEGSAGMPPAGPDAPAPAESTFVTLPPLLGIPDGREAWRGYTPAEEDEHFEPPDPDLPPVHDATYWAAVGGLVLGPLVVIWAAFLSGNPDPGWWIVTGITLTVLGFGLLILRGSTEDDLDDDGARV